MFCSGCLNKLPAFVATGPSALETLTSKRAASSISAASTLVVKKSVAKTNFPIGIALLLIALCTVFVGWVASTPRTGKATLQVAAGSSAGSLMASAPGIIPHSSPAAELGEDRVSPKRGEGVPTMRAMDEQAPTHPDLSALDTVVVFYRALSVGDGRGAAAV